MITEKTVAKALCKIGMPCSLGGYEYAKKAVMFILSDEHKYRQITKVLYPSIAKEVGTTPERVERCIRHAVERAFDYGSARELEEIFGNCYSAQKGKPTNSEILFTLAEYLKCKEG